MSDLETGKTPDNSTRLPLTGWKLWSRLLKCVDSGETLLDYYKDRAFPACPACGSPNVMVRASRKGHSYLCLELDCKSGGQCEVQGSDGIARRKAKVRVYVVAAALLALITVLFLTGHLPNSP
jgi:hypothetical protein